MAKKLRVYELAKHYSVENPDIMRMIRDMHAEAKSHMSVVDEDIVDKIHAFFQRKRDLTRKRYADDHNMDPEKLKHVASFKPLERPQPPEETEKEKEAAKKKAAKKKVTKKKATKKKVTKKKATKKKVTKKKVTKKATKKKVVKKAEPEETPVVVAGKEEPKGKKEVTEDSKEAVETATPKARIVRKEDIVEEVETSVEVEPETEASEEETDSKVDVKSEEKPAEKKKPQKKVRRQAKIIRKGDGVVKTTSGVTQEAKAPPKQPQPEEQTWSWNEVESDLIGGRRKKPTKSQEIRESVEDALKRRQEKKEAQPESGRRKRRKKRKVDEAVVAQNLKQTMAQLDGLKGGKKKYKKSPKEDEDEDSVEVAVQILKVTNLMSVQELADKFEITPKDIIAKLFMLGQMVTINQRLDSDAIEMIASEFEKEIEFLDEVEEVELETQEINEEDLIQRPPVVTVMGHVDHGKTSLLDYIRETNVIAGEAGGITQHIGAYKVETPGGPITFLDTPGHEAFSAMRARGTQVTDIVILIVAADDRIMPQTKEAISHAKSAGVPIIVAINKIDLPAANVAVVKQELLSYEVVIEEFGGDVQCAEISAKHGTGIEELLEKVHLQEEMLELKAAPDVECRGVVVEASKDSGRGVVFTVLIDQGTLQVGDNFIAGMQDGKVKALMNERGEALHQVRPSEPAVILGASGVPQAGDRLFVVESERIAREVAAKRRQTQRVQAMAAPKKTISLDNIAEIVAGSDLKELPIIVKGDVAGSVEAICDALQQMNTDEVEVRIVHKGVGAVNESDVLLAGSTGALVIGFHMRPGSAIMNLAESQHVTIETFDIIYEVVDTMKKAMAGLLDSIKREVSTGTAEIREVFKIPKAGTIAGSYVIEGKIIRNSLVRLVRDEVMIFEGKISSLKRFKDDAKEVQSGYECGIGLENFHDLQEGDRIETFRIEEEERTEL
ncbi:MAG: translation initiation factor IF-2 [bacterium]|nr:translation initiation factor IF-2 [bacterium]